VLARSVALNFAGNVGSLVVAFAGSLLLGRLLGPTDRGLLGVMTTFSSVGVGVFGLGLPMAVLYYASLRDSPAGSVLGNSFAFGILLAAVLIPVSWLLHGTLADVFGKGRGGLLWVLAATLIPLTFLDWTTRNQLVGALRFGLFNALTVAAKVAALVLVVTLVLGAHLGVLGGLIATAATSAVIVAGALPPLLGLARPTLDVRLLRRMLAYGSRVQVGTMFQILNYRLDVLVLQFFAPLSVVGYYVVAQIIAELVTTLAQAFGTSVLPLIAHDDDHERRSETTATSLRHHGLLTLLAVAANAGFGTVVIWWGYGSKFHAAVAPMLILLPAMWFLGTGQVVTGDLRGRGRPGLSSAIAGLTVVVTIVLDVILIPPFQAIGAAIASFAAYTVFGIVSLAVIANISGVPARSLVVPRRSDFADYGRMLARVRARLRNGRGGEDPSEPRTPAAPDQA
jgi:O-antigen/teichoic acid export membrane protein